MINAKNGEIYAKLQTEIYVKCGRWLRPNMPATGAGVIAEALLEKFDITVKPPQPPENAILLNRNDYTIKPLPKVPGRYQVWRYKDVGDGTYEYVNDIHIN